MSRRLRYVPEGGALMEVTSRTIQSRFLLRPSPDLNEIIVGALGRARELYPVELCGAAFLSNHYHLLLWVPDAKRLPDFMGHFNSNLAREVGRRTRWGDKIWSRRYQSIAGQRRGGRPDRPNEVPPVAARAAGATRALRGRASPASLPSCRPPAPPFAGLVLARAP